MEPRGSAQSRPLVGEPRCDAKHRFTLVPVKELADFILVRIAKDGIVAGGGTLPGELWNAQARYDLRCLLAEFESKPGLGA